MKRGTYTRGGRTASGALTGPSVIDLPARSRIP